MLDRPHIEFVHAQLLPWRRIAQGHARPDAEFKFLSRDPRDGACSILIRYPSGWRREGPEHIAAAEEFYVLEGALEINGDTYQRDHYGRIAPAATRRSMSAPGGAVVLTFLDSEPELRAGSGREADAIHIDVLHTPWDMSLNDPNLAHLGISRKDLFLDPETGERTFLSMVLPHSEPPGRRGPTERHPVVEEAYVINGSLTGPHGTMGPGAYFWRPPDLAHGPFGTRFGCVMLIRFLGGKHVNIWSEGEADFDFDAPYDPVLPEYLRPYARLQHVEPPRF